MTRATEIGFMALAMLGACSAGEPEAAGRAHVFENSDISLSLPSSARVKKVPNTPGDFDFYRIFLGERQILGVYLGNHPNFPGRGGEGLQMVSVPSASLETDCLADEAQDIIAECIVTLHARRWPQFAHIGIIGGLTDEERDLAMDAVASFRLEN